MTGVMSGVMEDPLIRTDYGCAITLEYLQEHARMAYQCSRNAGLRVASFGLRENVLECRPIFARGKCTCAAEIDQRVEACLSRPVGMPVFLQVRTPTNRLIDEFVAWFC